MIDFTKIPNIHYWTQRVLPLVFDESLSYVEKLDKLEHHINEMIEDYNKFGENVVSEINTFEGETTNQINAFVTQVTNDINSFKENVTNNINSFETDIRNIVEEFETTINNDIATFKQTITTQQQQFETRVNNDITAMQEVVNNIPETITTQVNALTIPWLQENAPTLVPEAFIQPITPKSITDLNQLGGNTLYATQITSSFTNYPSDIPLDSYVTILTPFRDTQQTLRMQYLQVNYIATKSNLIGSIRFRYEITSGAWTPWFLTDYYQMSLIRREVPSSVDTFTQSGVYYNGGESGANWSGTIPADLETGKYYIQTVANSSTEIIQTIINGNSTGNPLYVRMKYGDTFGEWRGISQRELLWSGVKTVTNPYHEQGYTHIETTGITDVEISETSSALSEFVASHEVIVSVSPANITNIVPPVTTGYTFGVTTDEITGKKVVKINVVLENMTASGASGTAYYVSYKLYKVN